MTDLQDMKVNLLMTLLLRVRVYLKLNGRHSLVTRKVMYAYVCEQFF